VSESDPIASRVERYIIEQFLGGEGPLEWDLALFEEGILDSFGFMLLLTFLQEAFVVQVQMRDITMDRFDTIEKIAAQVRAAGSR
jgi:D-alanine--poly(phosphoribitol) ligase subunit 2